ESTDVWSTPPSVELPVTGLVEGGVDDVPVDGSPVIGSDSRGNVLHTMSATITQLDRVTHELTVVEYPKALAALPWARPVVHLAIVADASHDVADVPVSEHLTVVPVDVE